MKKKDQRRLVSPRVSAIALAVGQACAPGTGAEQADSAVVVVAGIRASARSSAASQKDTMAIVDSVTAEDIGKRRDPNVRMLNLSEYGATV